MHRCRGSSGKLTRAQWRGARVALVAALAVAAPGLAGAQPTPAAAAWTVASGDVRVRCRITVGGSFDAVTSNLSGTLRGSAAKAAQVAGELRVDLATLDTGIGLRDDHLRANYLEVERGPGFRYAVLSGIVLDDPLPAGRDRHESTFTGSLTLHGVRRAVEGEAELRRRNGRMRVEATLSLSLEAFAIPPPRHLGVGVRDQVSITVSFDAAAAGAALPDRSR